MNMKHKLSVSLVENPIKIPILIKLAIRNIMLQLVPTRQLSG